MINKSKTVAIGSGFCYNNAMDDEMIIHLEELAKLKLTEEERRKIAPCIKEVIECFNSLEKLDTEGVGPLTHAFGLKNVMRSDTVKPSLSLSDVTSNAETENGFFSVPSSVDGGEA